MLTISKYNQFLNIKVGTAVLSFALTLQIAPFF